MRSGLAVGAPQGDLAATVSSFSWYGTVVQPAPMSNPQLPGTQQRLPRSSAMLGGHASGPGEPGEPQQALSHGAYTGTGGGVHVPSPRSSGGGVVIVQV